MCSYAKYQVAGVQQTPAYGCENAFGLQDVLRTQFGFTGWVGPTTAPRMPPRTSLVDWTRSSSAPTSPRRRSSRSSARPRRRSTRLTPTPSTTRSRASSTSTSVSAGSTTAAIRPGRRPTSARHLRRHRSTSRQASRRPAVSPRRAPCCCRMTTACCRCPGRRLVRRRHRADRRRATGDTGDRTLPQCRAAHHHQSPRCPPRPGRPGRSHLRARH